MPKIIIKEIDYTTAGSSEYKNFAVLVPGFCAEGKGIDCFDDNGIYECEKLSEFKEKIGVSEVETGVCATYEILDHTVTEAEFNGIYKNQCYSFSIISKTSEQIPGRLKVHNEIGWFKLSPVAVYVESEAAQYAVVLTGNEGADSMAHLGNQIAAELLSLGYKVLYKKLDDEVKTPAECIAKMNTYDFWEVLEDKSNYDFRYIINGLLENNSVACNQMSKLATTRGDCIALVDIACSAYSNSKIQKENIESIQSAVKNYSGADKYSMICAPFVTYANVLVDGYNNRKFPASFHYLACAARAQENNFAEWYAVAGYTRGICKYSINAVGCKLGEAAINKLQARQIDGENKKSINLITNIRGTYYLWGNRTAHDLDTKDLVASHFLNIRNLCCTLKKQLYINCRQLTFDPNSDILWTNFCDLIRPTLEKMKSDQGITDYKIVKAKTSKKATLRAIVRIVPIEAVEDFEINVFLEDSLEGQVAFVE